MPIQFTCGVECVLVLFGFRFVVGIRSGGNELEEHLELGCCGVGSMLGTSKHMYVSNSNTYVYRCVHLFVVDNMGLGNFVLDSL